MRIISDIHSMATFESVCYDELFLQGPQLSYRPFRDSFTIRDLSHALKRGKDCVQFSLSYEDKSKWLDLVSELDGDLAELLACLTDATDREGSSKVAMGHGLTAYRSTYAGIRTFSPFALAHLKPLDEVPAKWSLAHARRALANGQYEQLRCDGVYTDDYAYDAATDFQKGALKPLRLLRHLIESPEGGWWTSLDKDGVVGVSCHHFEHNSFILKLDNRAPAIEPEILG